MSKLIVLGGIFITIFLLFGGLAPKYAPTYVPNYVSGAKDVVNA